MTTSPQEPSSPQYAAFVAIDWADEKHAFSIQAVGHDKKETGVLEQKPHVISSWISKLRQRFGDRPIAVAVEQSRGALIHALLPYEFLVLYPLHPIMVARFREAFKSSGSKTDPLDTEQILEILTKHLDLLRPLHPDTVATRLLGRLVEDRRKTVDLRTSHIEALEASLKEYFPQALELLSGNLASDLAGDFLKKWPCLEAFQKEKASTIRRFFYAHNIRSPKVLESVMAVFGTGQSLTTDSAIVESGWRLSQVHSEAIQTLNPLIKEYEQRIEQVFNNHPEKPLFDHLPGAGPAMAPRLLAVFGTDRSRFEQATNLLSFTGIGPVTRSSGKSKVVLMRRACPKFERQTFHEFARLSVKTCQWARNYVDYYTAKDKSYHTIMRALAFKWGRVLFRCWHDKTPYEDEKYMQSLRTKGSIFATYHLEHPASKIS